MRFYTNYSMKRGKTRKDGANPLYARLTLNQKRMSNGFPIDAIKDALPEKQIFKTMGLGNINAMNVYKQLIRSFGLNKK